MKNYANIEQKRFGERMKIEFDISTEVIDDGVGFDAIEQGTRAVILISRK